MQNRSLSHSLGLLRLSIGEIIVDRILRHEWRAAFREWSYISTADFNKLRAEVRASWNFLIEFLINFEFSSSLMVRFFANGGTDAGYRAKVSFLTVEQSKEPELKARIGCGGLVETVGGAITMMNMVTADVNETDPEAIFDCIWIVRPSQGYMHMKTHISLKVETFEKMASKSEISIVQGTTSDHPELERIESSPLTSVSSRNLVVPITAGFYVRLRGKFNAESRLAIVYTAFSYSSKSF